MTEMPLEKFYIKIRTSLEKPSKNIVDESRWNIYYLSRTAFGKKLYKIMLISNKDEVLPISWIIGYSIT